jgi:hypothetical protein
MRHANGFVAHATIDLSMVEPAVRTRISAANAEFNASIKSKTSYAISPERMAN